MELLKNRLKSRLVKSKIITFGFKHKEAIKKIPIFGNLVRRIYQTTINFEDEIINFEDVNSKLELSKLWKDLSVMIKSSPEYREFSKISSAYIKDNIIAHKSCPICDSPNLIVLGRSSLSSALMLWYQVIGVQTEPVSLAIFLRLHEVFGNHGIGNDVCICTHCGSLFLNNVLSDNLKMKFNTVDSNFSSATVPVKYSASKEEYPKVPGREELLTKSQRVTKLKQLCRTFLGPKSEVEPINVLDIGARGGALSLPLNQNTDSHFTLIESDIAFRPAVMTNANIEIYNGLLHDFVRDPMRANRYDIIVALHILEHVVSPREFLHDIHSLLNDHGIAIIEVPYEKGCPRNTSRGRYYQWNHNHLFTPESLRTLISNMDCFNILNLEVDLVGFVPGIYRHCTIIMAVICKAPKSRGGFISDGRYGFARGIDELTETFAGSAVCFNGKEFYIFVRDRRDLSMIKAFLGEKSLKAIITDNHELSGRSVGDQRVRFVTKEDFGLFGEDDMIVFVSPHDAEYFKLHCSSKPILI
jgi:2-polyprenyl-3-methyl-5-hydroxy-6-metoxy-1,4-benzoquinol methylase